MIKINLLGDDTALDNTGTIFIASYVGSFATLLIIFFFIYSSVTSEIDEVNNRIHDQEIQLSQLKEKTKEVKELENTRDELSKVTLAIGMLKKGQEGPVRVLDDIRAALPEKVWVKDITQKEGSLKIEGFGLNDPALVAFMKQLEQSPYFERIDLKESISAPLAQITTYNSFTNTFYRYVIRGEKDQVQSKLNEIRMEAEKNGLKFESNPPPEAVSTSKATNATAESQANTAQLVKEKEQTARLTNESGFGRRRAVLGSPTLYAWESLEKVQGKVYTLEVKLRITPKSANDVPASGVAAPQAPDQKATKNT